MYKIDQIKYISISFQFPHVTLNSTNRQAMTFTEVIPYIYAILANVNLVVLQILYKMLLVVLPPTIILSLQSFFLLAFNTYIIVSNQKYRDSYKKYDPTLSNSLHKQVQLSSEQNEDRLEINIKDHDIFGLILSRLFFTIMGIWMLGVALQTVPLSINNALVNTGPIMIYFIQSFFYHKPLNKLHLLFTITSFCGVLIIIDPFNANATFETQYGYHLLLPLFAALVSSLGYIFLHELKGKVNQFVTLQYTYICQALYFHFLTNFAIDDVIILQMADPSKKYFQASIFDPFFVLTFLLMTVFAYLCHICRLKAIYLLKPSRVAPFNYITIILAIVVDTTVFGHQSSFWEIFGLFLTSVGVLSHFVFALKEGEEKEKQKKKQFGDEDSVK